MGKRSREKKTQQTVGYQQAQMVCPQNRSFSFLKVFILLGTLLALFTPLLVADRCFFPYVSGKSMYFMAFAEMVFFAWLALMSFRPEYRPKKSVLLIVLGLLLASMAISTALGVDPSRSFWSKHERVTGLLMWLHLFGFFLAVSSTFKRIDWLWIFGFSNFAGILVSLGAMFFLNSSSKNGGTLGNESFLGTYLLLNSFLAVYLLFFKFKDSDRISNRLKKFVKIFAAFSLAVFSFVLLFEGTQFWINFIENKDTSSYYGKSVSLIGDPINRSYNVSQAEDRFASGLQLLATDTVSAAVNEYPASLSNGVIVAASGSDAKTVGYHSYDVITTLPGGATSSAKVSYYVREGLIKDILSNGARAAKYCFLGGLFLIAMLYFAFESKRWQKPGKIFLALSSSAVAVMLYLATQSGNPVYQEFVGLATKARILIWQSAWQSFLERPWFGWGPENFEIAFSLHFDPRLFIPEYGGEVWFDRAHNIIMDNLVALGMVGSILYIAVFVAAFYILGRLYFSKKIDFITAAVPMAAFIAYFLQNLTVFDMVSSLMLFFLILGFIASTEKEAGDGEEEAVVQVRTIRPAVAAPVFLVAFLFCFFEFVVSPIQNSTSAVQASLKAEQIIYQRPDIARASAVQAGNETDQRIEAYKETLATSPIGKYQIVEFFCDSFEEFSLSQAAEAVPSDQLNKEFDYLAEALGKNIEASPLDFRAYLKLGQLYNAWARIDSSKEDAAVGILETAMGLSPNNQQVYWDMAQAKFNQQKPGEAMALAEAAIKLEPMVERSHFIAMMVAEKMNNKDLFEEKKSEALKINPGWQTHIDYAFPSLDVE
jgi:tetratricopeptide (TPR) repeat protein